MSIFLDILFVAIFLFFVIWLTKNGFINTVYKIGKTWLSVFCSAVLGPFVASKIQDWFLTDALTKGINSTLTNLVENNPNQYSLEQLFENLPNGFVNFLEHYNINLAELQATYGTSTQATAEILQDISANAAQPFSAGIASILGHVFCFVFSLLFFAWLKAEIHKYSYISFFRYADHVEGFFIGIAAGYCAVWGLATLLFTIFQIIIAFNAQSSVMDIYGKTYVFKFVNEFDLIGNLKRLWDLIVSLYK